MNTHLYNVLLINLVRNGLGAKEWKGQHIYNSPLTRFINNQGNDNVDLFQTKKEQS